MNKNTRCFSLKRLTIFTLNLKLINCEMENTDLSFEYSDVEADIKGHIDSVKNPKSGLITADSIGKIIREDAIMPCSGEVCLRKKCVYA